MKLLGTKDGSKVKLIDACKMVEKTLNLIKEQTGLNLQLCEQFSDIGIYDGRKYFNVILKERISESQEYAILERFAEKYKLVSVQPNGVFRVAIFPS